MAKIIENTEPKEFNLISSDAQFTGNFKSTRDIRINGNFSGTISTQGKLIIGPASVVEGEISCQHAEIAGKVNANIKVAGVLTVKSTAKIIGDISVDKISIEPGAIFSGNCLMQDNAPLSKGISQQQIPQQPVFKAPEHKII